MKYKDANLKKLSTLIPIRLAYFFGEWRKNKISISHALGNPFQYCCVWVKGRRGLSLDLCWSSLKEIFILLNHCMILMHYWIIWVLLRAFFALMRPWAILTLLYYRNDVKTAHLFILHGVLSLYTNLKSVKMVFTQTILIWNCERKEISNWKCKILYCVVSEHEEDCMNFSFCLGPNGVETEGWLDLTMIWTGIPCQIIAVEFTIYVQRVYQD